MEIPGGRGEQPEALWNGKSGGVGAQTVNNPPWGGYGYFLELHNLRKYLFQKKDYIEFIQLALAIFCLQFKI